MNIEIITTPNDALKESGFGAIKACNSVLDAIKALDYTVRLNVCKTEKCLSEVVERRPDLVILAVKYIPLEDDDDIWLSDYFSQHGINYTGSSREVLKFDSNKVLAKTHLTNKGIKTARYFLANPGQYKHKNDLPISFPLFLKPLDAANGNGIDDKSFVTNFKNYESKVASLYDSFKQPILVEEYLDGREFTAAIIRTPNNKFTVSAIEVIPPTSTHGLRILGAQTKQEDSEKLIEIVDPEVKNKVTTLAVDAFKALGVRDYGRIDVKTDNHGECYFIEANLVPGMTHGSSYFPEACNIAHGLSYVEVIKLLIAEGIARATTTIPPNTKDDSDNTLATAI